MYMYMCICICVYVYVPCPNLSAVLTMLYMFLSISGLFHLSVNLFCYDSYLYFVILILLTSCLLLYIIVPMLIHFRRCILHVYLFFSSNKSITFVLYSTRLSSVYHRTHIWYTIFTVSYMAPLYQICRVFTVFTLVFLTC